MPQQEENRRSIVFDELNATWNRIKLIRDNSDDPVEVFLAVQLESVLYGIIGDVSTTLNNPVLESTAEDFVKSMRQDDGNKH